MVGLKPGSLLETSVHFVNEPHLGSIISESLGQQFSKYVVLLTSTTASPGDAFELQNTAPSANLLLSGNGVGGDQPSVFNQPCS